MIVAFQVLPALAADGTVLINQARALAGNVTPGDGAGYPIIISRPGSYRLASNLIPGPGLSGIEVHAPDVTIDFNGFVLSGGPAGGTNNSFNGIIGQGDRLTVLNGKINSFEDYAIDNILRQYLVVENMRIINNEDGILSGSMARIQNNTIATNSTVGLQCGASCHVEGNLITGNIGPGIVIASGTVLGNTIHNNAGGGIINESGGPDVGFGNNTLIGNGNPQVSNVLPMQHNLCSPAC